MSAFTRDTMTLRLAGEQGGRCAYCGFVMRLSGLEQASLRLRPHARRLRDYSEAKRARRATRDHIVPRSAGGSNEWENLVAACHWCNLFRANQPWDVAFRRIQRLIRRGSHPHQVYLRTGWWPSRRSSLQVIRYPKHPWSAVGFSNEEPAHG